MSSTSFDSELSSAELRSKLFHSFNSKGVVQSVKAQLRKKLALELHQKALASNVKQKESKLDGTLFQRICNSLFVDHLKRCTYDYTYSVFITESNTSLNEEIPLHDILELLHINTHSKLHQLLVKACADSSNVKGFLWTFLVGIAQNHGNPTSERSVQTDAHDPSLDKKIFEIEKSELEKLQSCMKNEYDSVEVKLLAFQRKYETQKQMELKNEVERFRSSELAGMRMEERDKCQKEFMQMKAEYEKRFESKLKDLERREMEINSRAFRQEKETEKEGYEKRQKILEEMEALKQRDMELQRNHKSALNVIEVEEEKLKAKEEQLKQKERSIEEIEEHYENKLKHGILRIKLELQEKDIEQVAAMEVREQQLREEKMNFLSQKDVYMKRKEEADILREENEHLNTALTTLKHTCDTLSHNYEKVCEQYGQVNDYADVKNENMVLHKELEMYKKSYTDLSLEKAVQKKEHQKMVRDLLNKINQSSPQLENELKLLQEKEQSVVVKYEILQNKHDLLQKSHVLQLKKNEELRKLYENILLSQRELLRECDELKLELHFSKQENESALRLRSAKPKTPFSISEPTTSGVRTSVSRDVMKGKLPSYDIMTSHTCHNNDIGESNEILQELEREAMELEKTYKQFQERQMSIQTQLPAYVEKTKIAMATSQNVGTRRSDDAKEDANALPTSVMSKSDSFDLSHLIPSRRMGESNEGRGTANHSISTPLENQSSSLMSTGRLSSRVTGHSRVPEHQRSTAISLANSQLDSALSRFEDSNNEYTTVSSRHHVTKSYDDILLSTTEKLSHVDSHVYPPPTHVTPSIRSKFGTLGAKSLQMNSISEIPVSETNPEMHSLTPLPLTETHRPMDSLTQLPLMETIQPINSLTEIPLMETILPRNSLTQLPLSETNFQPMESQTQLPIMETLQPTNSLTHQNTQSVVSLTQLPFVETTQQVDSLTQLTLVETTRAVDSLTQLPLMETPQPVNSLTEVSITEITRPMDSLTQLPLTETVVSNASLTQFTLEEETKANFASKTPHAPSENVMPVQGLGRTDENLNVKTLHQSNAVTSVTYTAPGLAVSGMETSDIPVSNNFNTRNDDFDSKSDIFKSSNFMIKGFQSTRIASDELQRPSNETPEKRSNSVEIIGKGRQRHSTPETDKNSEVESIRDLSGKPQASSIGKENVSSDTSNVASGPFDSEEKVNGQKPDVKAGECNMERTFSEGEVGHGTRKSEGEVSHAGDVVVAENCKSEGEVFDANPMDQYMQMILAQREVDSNTGENGGYAQTDIQHSLHEDIPLSEIDEKTENSEPSSEFEW